MEPETRTTESNNNKDSGREAPAAVVETPGEETREGEGAAMQGHSSSGQIGDVEEQEAEGEDREPAQGGRDTVSEEQREAQHADVEAKDSQEHSVPDNNDSDEGSRGDGTEDHRDVQHTSSTAAQESAPGEGAEQTVETIAEDEKQEMASADAIADTDSVDLRERSTDIQTPSHAPPQQIMLGEDNPQQTLDAMTTASRARARSILEPSTAPIDEAAAKALADDDDVADDFDTAATPTKTAMAHAPAGLEQLMLQQQQQQLHHHHHHQQQQTNTQSQTAPSASQEDAESETQDSKAAGKTQHGSSLAVKPEMPTPLSPTTAAIRTIAAVKAAWILPPEVKRVIDKRRETGAEGADVSVVAYGSPGIAVEEVAEDRLQAYARRHGVESLRRRSSSFSQSSQDELRNIRRLMKEGSWRTALKLTSNFLTRHGQGLGLSGQPTAALHTPDTLQMWYLRTILLCQLRMYDMAEKELDSFGTFDRADLFYEYYHDKQRYELAHGSMVPFGLRLLHAELPRRRGRTKEAIDRLFALLHTCNQLLARYTAAADKKTGKKTKKNHHHHHQQQHHHHHQQQQQQQQQQQGTRSGSGSDSGGAVGAQEQHGGDRVEEKRRDDDKEEEENDDDNDDLMDPTEAVHVWRERQRHVLFAVGNALCALQDYRLAARVFERMLLPATPRDAKLLSLLGRISLLAGDITAANRKFTRVAEMVGESDKPQVLCNAALLELAKGDTKKAAQLFADAQRASGRMDGVLANNWAVMTLYSGNLQLAVRGVETSMRELSALDETLVFNLASMYELQSSRDVAHKKEWIPRLLECVHDGFNMTVLKLREA